MVGADLLVLRGRRTRGAGLRRRADRRASCARPDAGAARDQQDRRQARAEAGAWSSTSSGSSRCSRFRPSTARASATCSTKSCRLGPAARGAADSRLRAGGSDGAVRARQAPSSRPRAPRIDRDPRRHRRAAERRQVVAGQPAAARGARARQRHAGHDARRHRLAAPWHRRRFRIVDTAGMRRPGRVSGGGKVEMVSVALRQGGDRRRRRRRARRSTRRRARPTRTRPSAAKPIAPAAASSSSRTSGIW